MLKVKVIWESFQEKTGLISLLSKFPNVALVHESDNYIRRTSTLDCYYVFGACVC